MPHITGRDFSHNRFYEHCFTTQLRFAGHEGMKKTVSESGWDKRTNNGNSIRPVFEARKENQPKGTSQRNKACKKGKATNKKQPHRARLIG